MARPSQNRLAPRRSHRQPAARIAGRLRRTLRRSVRPLARAEAGLRGVDRGRGRPTAGGGHRPAHA
eukprot:9794519-Alexandrium_andersonii.AAC.1